MIMALIQMAFKEKQDKLQKITVANLTKKCIKKKEKTNIFDFQNDTNIFNSSDHRFYFSLFLTILSLMLNLHSRITKY